MQDYLCSKVDADKFPIIKKFIKSKNDGTTKSPSEISKNIISVKNVVNKPLIFTLKK